MITDVNGRELKVRSTTYDPDTLEAYKVWMLTPKGVRFTELAWDKLRDKLYELDAGMTELMFQIRIKERAGEKVYFLAVDHMKLMRDKAFYKSSEGSAWFIDYMMSVAFEIYTGKGVLDGVHG